MRSHVIVRLGLGLAAALVTAIAMFPTAALPQTGTVALVGRTCIGSYNILAPVTAGASSTIRFKGAALVHFLASDKHGTVRVERYRITDANLSKLATTTKPLLWVEDYGNNVVCVSNYLKIEAVVSIDPPLPYVVRASKFFGID